MIMELLETFVESLVIQDEIKIEKLPIMICDHIYFILLKSLVLCEGEHNGLLLHIA